MSHLHRDFMGAKIALFIGPDMLVLHRDDRPGLLWPGFWDLPGGGREGDESPLQTVRRETREEFGLVLPCAHIRWARASTNSIGRSVWFFVGALPDTSVQAIRFGNEGQGWALMSPQAFQAHPKAVPQFKQRLADYTRGVAPDDWDFREKPPA